MKRLFLGIFITALFVALATPAFAQIPRTINYQGVLADPAGAVVADGNYSITFKIYSAATGTTTPLWTETQSLPVSKGIFNAMLGSVTTLSLPFDAPYWLGMNIGTGAEMTPRIPFTSVAYSLNSRAVSDGALTANSIKSGQVVKSVNSLTDNVTLQAGSNISITPAGNTLTIAATGGSGGGVTSVNSLTGVVTLAASGGATISTAGNTITINAGSGGGGTGIQGLQNTDNTLDITNPGGPTATVNLKDGGVTTAKLANGAVTTDKIADGTISPGKLSFSPVARPLSPGVATAEIADQAVTGSKLSVPLVMDASNPNPGQLVYIRNSGIGSAINGVSVSGSGVVGMASLADKSGVVGVNDGAGEGVYGSSNTGVGVSGSSSGGSGVSGSSSTGVGVSGHSVGNRGVVGVSEDDYGVYGSSANAPAIRGVSTSSTGVSGNSSSGSGVTGSSTKGVGVSGNSTDNFGVEGKSESEVGVYGYTKSTYMPAVWGESINTSGVSGTSTNADGATGASISGNGVWGRSTNKNGVYGESSGPGYTAGVYGVGTTALSTGVVGFALSPAKQAGWFSGDVYVSGTLAKGAGSFKIDHPLDPANKYLYHSFVESPDMKNVYDGIVVLDGNGEAVVKLPTYYDALNSDARYQLTCVGGYAPVYIADEIQGNTFRIAGGKPRLKVSWQVTGIRKDGFAKAHRIVDEVEKTGEERGKYLHPVENGASETLGIEYPRYLDFQKQQAADTRDRQKRSKAESMKSPKTPRQIGAAGVK